MPQLPSGRHVGLDISPVEALWKDALRAQRVHQLMDIGTVEDLYPFVDIVYFKPSEAAEDLSDRLHESSEKPPPRLEPYASGFNLLSITDEWINWSEQDRTAFQTFIDRAKAGGFLDESLATVQKLKKDIAENGSDMAKVLAAWWRMGVHPLQPGGTDPCPPAQSP